MKKALLLGLLVLNASLGYTREFEAYDYAEDSFEDIYEDDGKKEFKRRDVDLKTHRLALSIETNFKVPLQGKDKYFGRIYLTDNQSIVKYRDELISERNYKKEILKPSVYFLASYSLADINSKDGLDLVDGAGAIVNLKSRGGNFSTIHGGKLSLKVKHPLDGTFTLNINISVKDGLIKNSLEIDGADYRFDTLKINASTMGIATGIKNVEFFFKGKNVYTYDK